MTSIFTLIDKLAQAGLQFKDFRFPIDLFGWFEEKPTYKYDLPLSSILESINSSLSQSRQNFPESSLPESALRTKENLLNTLINFSNELSKPRSNSLTYQEYLIFFRNSEILELDEEFDERLAGVRIQIFESNN